MNQAVHEGLHVLPWPVFCLETITRLCVFAAGRLPLTRKLVSTWSVDACLREGGWSVGLFSQKLRLPWPPPELMQPYMEVTAGDVV